MTSDGVNSYTWDRANRLLSMGGASHQYDGEGRRVQQTVSSTITKYLLDIQPSLAVVLSETTGSDVVRNIHAPKGIHARKDAASNWHWMMQDGLGSVRAEVSNSIAIEGSQNFAPYGSSIDSLGSFGTYGFTGEPTDTNGLVYDRARCYVPSIGIFASLDPFEGYPDEPMSLNGYGYVAGNPINFVDPSGNQAVCANNVCYVPENSCSPIVPMCPISVQQQQALISRLNPSCPVPPNAQLPSLMSTPVPGTASLLPTSTPQPNTSFGSGGLVLPLPGLEPAAPSSFGQAIIAGIAAFGPEIAFGGLVGANLYLGAKYPSETSTCAVPFTVGSTEWQQNYQTCGYLATVLAPSPTPSKVQLKPYRPPNGGHHIFSKAAWLQAAGSKVYMMGYDENAALAISDADLNIQKWIHVSMSTAQRRLFKQLNIDVQNGVKTNSLAEHAEIAREAMIAGLVPFTEAVRFVDEATSQLNNQFGIYAPYRIPWE